MSSAAKKDDPRRAAADDEITIERRVRMPLAPPTMRMDKIDARLLAIARGELEPDDPFGGLIPIYDHEPTPYDEDLSEDLSEDVQDGWLSLEPAPSSEEAMLGSAVPRVRLRPDELHNLDLSVSAAFLLSHVDGKRTLQEINEACRLDDLESLELLDELLRMGAIELF